MLSEFFAQGRGIRGGSGAKQTDGGELFDWSPSIPGTPAPLTFRSRKKKNTKRGPPPRPSHLSFRLEVKEKKKEKEIAACLFFLVLFVCLFFAV